MTVGGKPPTVKTTNCQSQTTRCLGFPAQRCRANSAQMNDSRWYGDGSRLGKHDSAPLCRERDTPHGRGTGAVPRIFSFSLFVSLSPARSLYLSLSLSPARSLSLSLSRYLSLSLYLSLSRSNSRRLCCRREPPLLFCLPFPSKGLKV